MLLLSQFDLEIFYLSQVEILPSAAPIVCGRVQLAKPTIILCPSPMQMPI